MGTFPPAIFLYNNNYDIISLVSQPRFIEGGPNVHSFSLITWITAAVMTITKNPVLTILILHLLTFATMAWTLHHLFRIARAMTGSEGIAIMCCLSTLFYPTVLVQTGYMYTEIPVLACSTAAISAWLYRRKKWVVFWCAMGILIKETALVHIVSISLALLFGRHLSKRFAYIASLSIPVVLKLFAISPLTNHVSTTVKHINQPFMDLLYRLKFVPDLWLMLLIGALIPVFWWRLVVSGIRSNIASASYNFQDSVRSIVMLSPLLFVLGVVYRLSTHQFWFLSRYVTIVVPFVLLSISYILFRAYGRRTVIAVLSLLTIFFAINYNGFFYLKNYASFSIVECSHRYQYFQQVQIQGLEALAKKPKNIPGYYCRDSGYMASNYMMGYLKDTIPNTIPIYLKPYKSGRIDEFPGHFFLLRSASQGQGSKVMDKIVLQAQKSPDWKIQVQKFSSNGFQVLLYEVERKSTN